MIPSKQSNDNLSPREKFLGIKTDVKRDLRIEFGQYVEAKVPNTIINSMKARTKGCIALLPKDNATGSVLFLNLASLQEVTRDQWTALPTPDIVIQKMKEMAEKQSRKLGNDPVFQYVQGIVHESDVAADEDTEPELQVNMDTQTTEIQESQHKDVPAEENSTDELELDNAGDLENDTDTLDYRGDRDTEIEMPYDIPDFDYKVDADGDVIMDDSEAIFHESRPKQDAAVSDAQHQYHLRQHRSNWKNKVFMTVIQRVKDEGSKYVYHTTIKECQRKLGIGTTNEAIKKELKQMLDKKVWQPEYYENVKDSAKLLPSMMFMKEASTNLKRGS